MAICLRCGRDMLTTDGCDFPVVIIGCKKYERIRVGGKGDFYEDSDLPACTDCGAHQGCLHHFGCDCEICPKCGDQFLFCGCDKKDLETM